MTDGILHNVRQQKALARSVQRTSDIETASISTYASSAALLKNDNNSKSSRKPSRLERSLQKLRGQTSRS
jgi:hypothetical protein